MAATSETPSPSISERHQSGELFVTLTLVSVLLAWMDRFFRLEVAERIRSTWRILGEYDPIASKIYQAWYPDTSENPISL